MLELIIVSTGVMAINNESYCHKNINTASADQVFIEK